MCNTRSQGSAAESGTVITDGNEVGDRIAHHDCTDGEAVGERLGHGDHVGVSVGGVVAVAPEGARAEETALDLVKDEHGTDLVASLSESLQELERGWEDATFSLHRLDNDTGGGLVDERLEAGDVVVGSRADVADEKSFLAAMVECSNELPPVRGVVQVRYLALKGFDCQY